MSDKRTVLVVGMGTSPAVMTETVWALAHQSEPVVPDEIVVITTKSGKDAAMRLHVRRIFDKYGQNLSKTAEALKVARNTVRRYL